MVRLAEDTVPQMHHPQSSAGLRLVRSQMPVQSGAWAQKPERPLVKCVWVRGCKGPLKRGNAERPGLEQAVTTLSLISSKTQIVGTNYWEHLD